MDRTKPSLLIVDDEQVVCDVLHDELTERGYRCTSVLSGDGALTKLAAEGFDVVLLDIRLPGMFGMEVLHEIWLNHRDTATIMITAVNDVDTAVEATTYGAMDYIVKPFDLDRVHTSICAALWSQQANGATKASTQMDAIALGIEAKHDPFFTMSRVVRKRTIEIARELGIAKEDIERWAEAKRKLDSKRDTLIKLELNKSR